MRRRRSRAHNMNPAHRSPWVLGRAPSPGRVGAGLLEAPGAFACWFHVGGLLAAGDGEAAALPGWAALRVASAGTAAARFSSSEVSPCPAASRRVCDIDALPQGLLPRAGGQPVLLSLPSRVGPAWSPRGTRNFWTVGSSMYGQWSPFKSLLPVRMALHSDSNFIPKLGRSIIGSHGSIITHYRPST